MTPFGYTVLGFGAGKGDVPIAEDLTYSYTDTDIVTQGSVDFEMDPYNANKCLLMWTAGDWDGQLQAGTISGDTITWGSTVEFSTASAEAGHLAFDPNTENSFLICWRDDPGQRTHTAIAGTISGTTITLGTKTDISVDPASEEYVLESNCIFNANRAGQAVTFSPNQDNSTRAGAAEIKSLTVSGTTVTVVNKYDVHVVDTCRQMELAWDMEDNDQFFMMYVGGGDYNYVRPATIAADGVITLGTEHTLDSGGGAQTLASIASDWNNAGRIVVGYSQNSRRYVYVRVGNLSGGTITWGTAVQVDDVGAGGQYINQVRVAMDKNTPNKFLVTWNKEVTGDAFSAVVGTISSTDTITLGTAVDAINSSGNQWAHNTNLERDPFNPGRFFGATMDTTDSSQIHVIGHQVASFEL